MNWTAIGAVAELLGAAGVVASLLYVGRQMRLHAQALREEAQGNAIESLRTVSLEMVRDPVLVSIVNRATRDITELDEDERTRLFFLCYNFLKAGERVHFLFLQGRLDEDTWAGLRQVLHAYLSSPAYRVYWQSRQRMFSPRFAVLVDALLQEEDPLPLPGEVARISL